VSTTTYRATVPLPLNPDSRREVIETLRQFGTVVRVQEDGARWELDAPDLYALAETVFEVRAEIAFAYGFPPTIPRPREVRAK
jgi:hypothetical protein